MNQPSATKVAGASLPISIRRITKRYGDFAALDDVSLEIGSGEFLTLLGPSGSGKTTLLMVLAGFVRPDYGSLRFGPDEVMLTPAHKRGVGMVFQNYALFPHMTVGENVGYPLRLRKVNKAEAGKRIATALAQVELAGYEDRRIDQLSGGQRQRVALARAIVFEPRILLMDEPLSALDKKLREQMQLEIRHLHDKLGMTTVYVTHDQREALTMSDRIAVVNKGGFQQIAGPRELYDRPVSRFVADFIGESSFLPVQVSGGVASLNGQPLKLSRAPEADGQHLLVLRPEKLDVLTGAPPADANLLDGVVRDFVFQGESALISVDLGGGVEIMVRKSTRREALAAVPPQGAPIRLAIHAEDTVLVTDS